MDFSENLLDWFAEDMLVERAGEVALEELVVIDGLGYDAAHKLEVAQMVGVAVGRWVGDVRHPVTGGRSEQGIHLVEDFSA